MTVPRWTVFLEPELMERCEAEGQDRLDSRKGKSNATVGDDELEGQVGGVIGECGFATLLDLDIEHLFGNDEPDGGIDFWMTDKISVDVKVRIYQPCVDTFCSYKVQLSSQVLVSGVVGQFGPNSVVFNGFLYLKEWHRLKEPCTFGKKEGFGVHFSKLNDFDRLLDHYNVPAVGV